MNKKSMARQKSFSPTLAAGDFDRRGVMTWKPRAL
jgi:hypothetical protein